MSEKKITIVVMYPYKFTDNYYRKYEIEFLKREFSVEVWDIGYFIYPKFVAALAPPSSSDDCVQKVSSWRELFAVFWKISKQKHIIFFQFFSTENFRSLVCCILMNCLGRAVIDFYNGALPILESSSEQSKGTRRVERGRLGRYLALVRVIQKRIFNGEHHRLYQELRLPVFQQIASLLSIKPSHRLIAGDLWEKKFWDSSEKNGIHILKGLSWDFSNSLAYQSTSTSIINERYAVLVEGAGPAFSSDQELIGRRQILTKEKWYPALTAFLQRLEEEAKLKIVIAGHPKSHFPETPQEFGCRRVYYGCTEQLVKDAEFMIMRFSTAFSYAVIHHKPVLMIYNNELKCSEVFQSFCQYSKVINVNPVNIDEPPSAILSNLKKYDDVYAQYRFNYLSTLENPRPNCLILKDWINSSFAENQL